MSMKNAMVTLGHDIYFPSKKSNTDGINTLTVYTSVIIFMTTLSSMTLIWS